MTHGGAQEVAAIEGRDWPEVHLLLMCNLMYSRIFERQARIHSFVKRDMAPPGASRESHPRSPAVDCLNPF